MKRIVATRPSPATVIACIALFAALGGVSYGFATGSIDSREIKNGDVRTQDIRNNSIRTGDLRNNEVRGIDVRNGTLRARDIAPNTITDDQIDESKLQRVPDAARLEGRPASDFAASRSEPVRILGEDGQPSLQSGFGAAGGDALEPGFWKDPLDVVHLQGGTTHAGPSPGQLIFTLPSGYRPSGTAVFAVSGGTVRVESDGSVRVGDGDELSLDGIAFRAD